MKKASYFLLSIFILSSFHTYGQQSEITVEVYYDYITNFFGSGMEYKINSKLTSTPLKSIYEMDHTGQFKSQEKSTEEGKDTKIDKNNQVIAVESRGNTFVYKDLGKQLSYFSKTVSFTPFYITDSSPNIDWKLTEESKDILGYTCQKAVGKFGGRLYDAYYTTEISIANGPWRFQGLPGLILEVASSDGVFSIAASSLQIKKENQEIENPYFKNETLDWQDFLVLYRKKYDQTLRNNWSENGATRSLPKEGIVKYIID